MNLGVTQPAPTLCKVITETYMSLEKKIHPVIHSFSGYSLKIYNVHGIALGSWHTSKRKQAKIPNLIGREEIKYMGNGKVNCMACCMARHYEKNKSKVKFIMQRVSGKLKGGQNRPLLEDVN